MNNYKNQSDVLASWFQRKTTRGWFSVAQPRTAQYEFKRCLGGRCQYAKVKLIAEPAEYFSFKSDIKWPDETIKVCTLDGIIDAISKRLDPVFGITVTVLEIGYHEVDSCPSAYYEASKKAMEDILSSNIDCERIKPNQQVDPIVTTPVDEVEAQSTQGHP